MGLLDDILDFVANGDLRTQAANIKVWLELVDLDGKSIGNLAKVPVSHVTLRFPLRGVPVAEFALNTGYDVSTSQLASIQRSLDKLENQVRVRCYAEIKGKNPDFNFGNYTRKWDEAGIFRIWDGLTLGPGYTLTRDQQTYTLTSRHWVSELDSATMLSQSFIRNAADNFLVSYGYDQAGGGTAIASLQALTKAGGNFSPPFDVWEKLIKPMCVALMTPSGGPDGGVLKGQNWEATLKALSRLCQLEGDAPFDASKIVLGNKLAIDILNTRFNDTKHIIKGDLTFNYASHRYVFPEYVAKILAHRMGSADCLEKLMMVASMCQFGLVANVETASFVPHIPVLNQKLVWREILPSEYQVIRGQGSTPRKLAGVGLLGMSPYRDAQAAGGDADRNMQGEIVGAFRRTPDGQFMIVNAPDWMHYQVPPDEVKWDVRSAMHPKTGNDQPSKPDIDSERLLGCRVAKAYWYEEVYRSRYMEITGKLRFDIAPGSIVKVSLPGQQVPQFGKSVYGCVQNVVVQIDANDPRASTSFGISHLRSEETKDWADFAHPVYEKTAWYGSPLVKLYSTDLKPLSNA